MLNITHYQRSENQNHNELSSHVSQNGCHQKVYKKLSAGNESPQKTSVEKREPSYTVGGNANWYRHYGQQCGDSLKIWKQNCHMIQPSHRQAYTSRKSDLKETHVPNVHCSTVYNNQDKEATQMSISRQMNKEVHIYNGILLSYKKNILESVLMRWMKLEPITQSKVSQKEKYQYSVLTHIYGIQKDGNDDPICKAVRDTDVKNILLDCVGKGEGGTI